MNNSSSLKSKVIILLLLIMIPVVLSIDNSINIVSNKTTDQAIKNINNNIEIVTPKISTSNNTYYNITNITYTGLNQSQTDLLYLSLTDQRYNETILANSKALPGICAYDQVVQNTTTSGVECITISELDTLQSVTDRNNKTTQPITTAKYILQETGSYINSSITGTIIYVGIV